MKYCKDFAKKFDLDEPCCSSCHEDSEWGYSLIHEEVDGVEYEICCTLSNAYDEKCGVS